MKKIFMAVLALSVFALPSLAEARKGGRKAASKRPAISAPAKTKAPKQQTQKPAVAQQQPANNNAAPATAQAPAQQQQRGGSMAGNIMSTAAGVAVGSVIADSITNSAGAEEMPVEEEVAVETPASDAPEAIEPAAE